MCCLFGLLDIKHNLSSKEKNRILSTLGIFCEARGVDATGYSYVSNRNLVIKKKAVPAHQMIFNIPSKAYVVMAHTRMTTQGNAQAKGGINNHPFLGKLQRNHYQFALAHNGVLSNDKTLRNSEQLPPTNIETDSYIAVQLIEKQKALDFNSLKTMAEKVKGTFTFTVMDLQNNLFIVKGNNPLCLFWFPQKGFYIYASTRAILEAALDVLGFLDIHHEEIPITEGEIVRIDAAGRISRDRFQMSVTTNRYYDCYDYYEDLWEGWEEVAEEPSGYRKFLMDYAAMLGIPQKELDHLYRAGVPDFELEECIYNKQYRRMCLLDTGYYSEVEEILYGNDNCVEDLPWLQA